MSEDQIEILENTPPRKTKSTHYGQKYSKSWEKEKHLAGWIASSSKGDYYFYCKVCNSDLKCEGGKFMVDRHSKCRKHLKKVKDLVDQPTIISKLGQPTKKSFDEKVKSGEIKMSCFLAKNNLPFNIAGDLVNLVKSVCPDSDVAQELTLGKTKAHAIVTNVTGKASYEKLLEQLRNEKFSLIADESTDRSTTKHMALIVRTAIDFNIEDNFLCLLPVTDCKAVALHKTCTEFFERENIPFRKNMIGFACDGANNMSGQYHSLSTLFAKDIPNIFLIKCICHSFHLCASNACKVLPREIEDFARDVYSYLKNSPKRLKDYTDFQNYLNIKPHKILHPSQTRWLSLLPVVDRLVEQLPALTLYFQGGVLIDKLVAANSILEKCLAPGTKLYLLFLKFVLPYFHDLNKEMQSESPKLFILYEKIFTTYRTLLECFIKPEFLELNEKEKVNSKDHFEALETKILNLDCQLAANHLPIEAVYLGGDVLALLAQEEFVNNMGEAKVQEFRNTCVLFYITSITQIKERFPFQDFYRQSLKSLSFLSSQYLITRKAVSSIFNLKEFFPDLCPSDRTELDREWRLLRNITFPFSLEENIRVEKFWHHVSKIKKGDNEQMFPLLSQFVQTLLVLPHSSANVERLFSAVNLLKTSNRNKLSTDTLQGVLHTKRVISANAEEFTPTDEHFKLFNKNMYSFKD